MQIHSYRDLDVWQRAMDLVVLVYQMLDTLPKHQDFVLKQQMQRCAISIPSNIAEGRQRSSRNEFAHFIDIAKGSTAELQTQLEICQRLRYISTENADLLYRLSENIMRMLHKLKASLKPKTENPKPESNICPPTFSCPRFPLQ